MTSATSRRPLSGQEDRDSASQSAAPTDAADALNEGGHTSIPEPRAARNAGDFSAPDYERLRALAALYEQPQRMKRRSVYRTVLMLLIFALGAGVGLAATWWFSGARTGPLPPSLSGPLSTVSASRDSLSAASARSGISASELPYDGRKPPATSMDSSVPILNLGELPYSGQPDEGTKSHVEVDAGKAKAANQPLRAATGQAAFSERAKAQLQAAPHKIPRSRSAARGMKDREIERIRQQADEELKKKSERSRTLNEARTRSRAPSSHVAEKDVRRHDSRNSAHMQPKLAKCTRVGNLIRREQCKWRLCSGMWGKNGCPSYAHAKPY